MEPRRGPGWRVRMGLVPRGNHERQFRGRWDSHLVVMTRSCVRDSNAAAQPLSQADGAHAGARPRWPGLAPPDSTALGMRSCSALSYSYVVQCAEANIYMSVIVHN